MKMNDRYELILSQLGHTWILDLDGTLVKHNGYLTDGHDTLLPGVREFLQSISEKDMIVILTSRKETFRDMTETFLAEQGVRYDHIIFDVPYGERILINDDKPSGLKSGYCINTDRDRWCGLAVGEDECL